MRFYEYADYIQSTVVTIEYVTSETPVILNSVFETVFASLCLKAY